MLLLSTPSFAQSIGGTPVDAKLIGKLFSGGVGLGQVANPPKVPTGLEIQRRGVGVVSEPRLDASLNDVLKDIQRGYPKAPEAARVYLSPDPSLKTYASPDGAIFVAAGMLQNVESRDELAALIAHEYAHVLLNHAGRSTLQEMTRKAQGLGTLYLAMRYSKSDLAKPDRKTMRNVIGYTVAMEGMQSGVVPSRTRKQETDADLLAVDLLVSSGYNPIGILDFLSRFEQWEADQEEARKAQKAREGSLRDVYDKTVTKEGDVGKAATATADAAVGRFLQRAGDFVGRGIDKARREHITPAQRIKAVRQYIDKQHANARRPEMRAVPWEGDRNVAKLFEGLESAHQLHEAVQKGEVASYPELMQAVRASPAASTAYGRYVMLLPQDGGQGKLSSARSMVQELRRDDSLFATHYLVLDLLAEGRHHKDAVQALELSRASLGDPPELLPYAERIYAGAGDKQRASIAHSKCVGTGNQQLQQMCMKDKNKK